MQLSVHPDRQQRGQPQRVSLLRKLIHLAMAIVPLAGWWISFQTAVALAGVLVAASLVAEAVRRWRPGVNHVLWHLIPSVFRQWEGQTVLGSTWFALGALAALAFGGRDAGGTAILFLAWGDPAAEFAGRRWGRKGQGKTLAGSLGCFLACTVASCVGIGLGGLNLWAALVGAVAATLVERWSPPPDDNLWMPVLSGLAIVAMERLG
jgi:dolichol kinase